MHFHRHMNQGALAATVGRRTVVSKLDTILTFECGNWLALDEGRAITRLSAEVKEVPMNKSINRSKSTTNNSGVKASSNKLRTVKFEPMSAVSTKRQSPKNGGNTPIKKMFDPLAGP
jgi:hypothetical protein